MMETGSPEVSGQLVLTDPEKWSSAASNFLDVTSQGTLEDIENVRRFVHSYCVYF